MAATLNGVDVIRKGEDVLRKSLVILQRDFHRVLFNLALNVQRPQVDPSLVAVEIFDEGTDAALEIEGVVQIDALIAQQDRQGLVEESELAQPVGHDVPVKAERFEHFGIRPESNVGAGGVGLADEFHGRGGGTGTVLLVELLDSASILDLSATGG